MRRSAPAGYGFAMVVVALSALGMNACLPETTVGVSSPSVSIAWSRSADATSASPPAAMASATDRASASKVGAQRMTLHEIVTNHVASSARKTSEAYAAPTDAELQLMGTAVRHTEADRLEEAASLLASLDYEVVRLTTPAGRHYVVLRESLRADGTPARHWGLYIVDLDPRTDLLVEVVHPIHDIDSHRVGLELFEAAGGRALLVAGAHRRANADGSADVARVPASVLETAHGALLRPGGVVVQPHGFDNERHRDVGHLVVSGGISTPPPFVTSLATSLGSIAEVCLYDGEACRDLAGTENVQGRSARAAGATFVHVEFDRALRSDAARREPVVRQMAQHLERSS